MVDNSLTVSGGAGGITARYDDMLNYAAGLDGVVTALIDRVPEIAAIAGNPDVIASAPLSPVTAARVEASVAAATIGPRGLMSAAVRLKATALSLRTAVGAYRAVDEAQARLMTELRAVGAVPVLLGSLSDAGARAGFDLLTHNYADLATIPGLAVQDLKSTLYANPWIVDGLITDTTALMQSLPVVLGPANTALISAWTLHEEGVPFPPGDLTQASGDLIAFGELFGKFGQGTPDVTQRGNPMSPPPQDMAMPSSVEGIFRGVSSLGREPGSVRVFAIAQPDGSRRWVVEIPGTQEWSLTAGTNPVDSTNNLRLMAGQQTVQNEDVRRAIRLAMASAGVTPGTEPVMLVGHSQGGITAASMAADPATRAEFKITNVVTGGAPIAGFAIPPEVHVLSLEHTQDAVPRLDGQPNPDRPTWVTVQRDPTGVPNSGGNKIVDDTVEVHNCDIYAQTGALVDQSQDPSIVSMRASMAPFLATDHSKVTVQDFTMTRKTP